MDWAEPLPDAEVARALVVMAHPDDADYGGAGTLAGWVAAGIEVTLLLCTRGEQGGFCLRFRGSQLDLRFAAFQASGKALQNRLAILVG